MEALRDSNIPSIIVDVQIVQIYTIGIRAKMRFLSATLTCGLRVQNYTKKIQLAKKLLHIIVKYCY